MGDSRRDAWLAARREVVTSTGLAALLGVEGSYGSTLSEFLDKIGRSEPPEEPAEYLAWGQQLQRPILIAYAEREGVPIDLVDEYEFLRSTTCPWIGASLDGRWQIGDLRPVDAKNIGYRDPEQWGEDYTDQVPARYVVQLHAQMEVLQAPVGDLAVLFGGRKLGIFRVQRDEEIVAACRQVAEDFMRAHVLPAREAIAAGEDPMRFAPAVDGSKEWTRFLSSRRNRLDSYLEVSTLPEDQSRTALDWAKKLAEAKEAKAVAEEAERLAGNHLRAIIGEHSGLIVPGARIDYKQNKDSMAFDPDGYIAYLERIAVARGAKPSALDRVKAKKFTTTKPGNRPLFLRTAKKAKKD